MVAQLSLNPKPTPPRATLNTSLVEDLPRFAFFHGPDKIPISIGTNAVDNDRMPKPFHGIASRGLLKKLIAAPIENISWINCAHILDDESETKEERLLALRLEARRSLVLTFQQSAQAAKNYVEACFTSLQNGAAQSCEIWNIKEGHTSSVWLITIHRYDNAVPEKFIVNVARDHEAGLELMRTADTMQAIALHYPNLNMAKVTDVAAITIDYFGKSIVVPVTRNEFVRNGFEVHCGTHRVTRFPTYVLVERFMQSEGRPAEIRSIRGRTLNIDECKKLEFDIESFLAVASAYFPVAIDINDGDIVWDGEKAVIVAIR